MPSPIANSDTVPAARLAISARVPVRIDRDARRAFAGMDDAKDARGPCAQVDQRHLIVGLDAMRIVLQRSAAPM